VIGGPSRREDQREEGSVDQQRWTEVDRYIDGAVVGSDPALDAALQDVADAGMPAISVTPALGKLLHVLARTIGARRILEVGTLGGYSTIWMARAVPAGGRVVSLEIDPRNAAVAATSIERAGVSDRVEIRVGRAVDTLTALAADGVEPFDLVFVDADKRSNPEYLAWALRLTHVGSVIVVDNVVRGGAVVDAETTDPDIQGIRRMNEMIAAEPRLLTTAIQTVGSKGYDGFAIALVIA
jgi:predicted O-methyltransferase YrrM